MMQVMPVAFGFCKSKFFNKCFFPFQVFDHLFNRYIVISDGWRFTIALETKIFQLHNQGGLMSFCPFRNSKRMTEFEIVLCVRNFQNLKLKREKSDNQAESGV